MRALALAVLLGTSLGLVVVGADPAAVAGAKPPKPVVTKLSPSSGPAFGGALVTIKGKNLGTARAVLFGTQKGTQLKVMSDRKVQVLTPASAEGFVDVRVQTKGGTSAKTPQARFDFFNQRPQVTSISPGSGPISGGTVVTVTGTGFVGVTAVTFDGTQGTAVSVVSPTQLTVTSPAHLAYPAHVNVTSSAGTSPSKVDDLFTYVV